jgi:hypothetical protein
MADPSRPTFVAECFDTKSKAIGWQTEVLGLPADGQVYPIGPRLR